jgi:DNA-3-methyladenine glycosylase
MTGPDARPAPDPIAAALLADDPVLVAPRLLGAVIHGRGVSVRLTEVEAYRGADDPGSHAFRGMTPRTAPMFRGPGVVYAYVSYGMHTCVNLVCGVEGAAAAILLRAGEVVAGEPLARERRAGAGGPQSLPHRDLARGPGRLARALGVLPVDSGSVLGVPGRRADGAPLAPGSPLALEPAERGSAATLSIAEGPRVGVSGPGGGAEFPWRFWIADDPTVSPYRAAVSRAR